MLGSFGRSTAKRYEHSADRTTFKDVAGIEEAEDELIEWRIERDQFVFRGAQRWPKIVVGRHGRR